MLKKLKKLFNPSFLYKSYLILFLMLFISIFFSAGCINNYSFLDADVCNVWLEELSINLIAEISGILLVLVSVNKTVRENREREKTKFREIAFRPLKIVLQKQIYLFFEIFKAATKEKPEKEYRNLEDLFDDTYFDELKYLDILKPAPVLSPVGDKMDWLDYLVSECSNLTGALNRVVDRYALYLESELVDLMEKMADAAFIRFINSIWQAKQSNGLTSKGDLLFACEEMLKEYAECLVRLVEIYNENVPSDRRIIIDEKQWKEWWKHKGRPQLGDSRIDQEI